MRVVLSVFGVVCLLVGGTFFLQGINILPGSFMTGQTKWAVCGAIFLVIGATIIYRVNRRTL